MTNLQPQPTEHERFQQQQSNPSNLLQIHTTAVKSLGEYVIGFNPGNANLKMVVIGTDKPIVMPSGIVWKDTMESRASKKDFKILRDPTVPHPRYAKNSWWTMNESAGTPISLGKHGKPLYALPLLVSAMWPRLVKDDVSRAKFIVYVLVHDPKNLAGELREEMQGEFHMSHQGVDKVITVEVKAVRREGAHMASAMPDVGNTLMMDWGGNTLISARYDDRRISAAYPPKHFAGFGSSGLARLIVSEAGPLIGGVSSNSIAEKFIIKPNTPTPELTQMFDEICDMHIDRAIDYLNRSELGIQDGVNSSMAFGGLCLCKPFANALHRASVAGKIPPLTIVKNPQTVDITNLAEWIKHELSK